MKISSKFRRLGCARVATTILFLNFGLTVGTWLSALVGLKEAFGLDAGQLGLLILLSGLGSLSMAMPVGRIIDRWGPKAVALTSGCGGPLLYMWLPTLAAHHYKPYLYIFTLSILTAGASIANNSSAADIEILWGSPIMSSFHAAFSIGGLLGSLAYAGLLTLGFPWSRAYPTMCVCVSIISALAAPFIDRGLQNIPREPHSPLSPNALALVAKGLHFLPLLTLGVVCFITLLVEGAIGDWSGIYLHEVIGVPLNRSPLGYSAFASAMGTMRLLGDAIIGRFGRRRVYRGGAVAAVTGLLIFLYFPIFYVELAACVVIGLGLSNMMPILMSTAARQSRGQNPGIAIATMSVLGQCGIMSGPAIIGFVARSTGSLRLALCLLPVIGICIIFAAPMIREKPQKPSPIQSPRELGTCPTSEDEEAERYYEVPDGRNVLISELL